MHCFRECRIIFHLLVAIEYPFLLTTIKPSLNYTRTSDSPFLPSLQADIRFTSPARKH